MTNPPPPRRFYLQRNIDVTGASGTGRVADGVLWPDGTVSIRWAGERPSIVFWGSIDDAEWVHGHSGATRIVWLDWEQQVVDPDLPCMHCLDGHTPATNRPWGVLVSPQRDGDGQPTHLMVMPTNGAHVANEDAAWLRDLIRGAGGQP